MLNVAGITLNNKHSYNDFGLRIISRDIDSPTKKKIKASVPFMNGDYDFSLIYGDQVYENRTLTYKFDLWYENKIEYMNKKIQMLEWLTNGIKEKLYDDLIPGYYFLVDCSDSVNFDEYFNGANITVTFTAYPFKISKLQEGHDIWDEFNFELDVTQFVVFNVKGIETIELYNVGNISSNPIVVCSSNMIIEKDGITYNFKAGENESWNFKLNKGLNKMTVKGTGKVEFKWFKEVL